MAAALGCLIVTQGVGAAYAAVNHTSILSLFTGESQEIQDRARTLRETKVDQVAGSNARQSAYAAFSVREALCDKNHVYVEAVARPASDEYLLVPSECWSEKEDWSVEEIGIREEKGRHETIAQYAKRLGKTCVEVNMWVNAAVDAQSMNYQMEADGTLVYDISFENASQKEKLDYTCDTVVYVPGQEERKLDEAGNEVSSKGGYGSDAIGKDGSLTECDEYSTAKLGDTLTFLVRNCMTKEVLGTVTVTQK